MASATATTVKANIVDMALSLRQSSSASRFGIPQACCSLPNICSPKPVASGSGRYKSFRTGEFATEREAIQRAHKLIDTRAIV